MLRIFSYILPILFLAAYHPTAFAVASAIAESLQMPAWIVHNDKKMSLKLGATIFSGDRIITGESARIRVRLAEQSTVKLGEMGEIYFANLETGDDVEPFKGDINVDEGAFRFTTSKKRRALNLNFHFRAISAGVRGTDIWGRSTDEETLLCLIEGKITVQRQGETPFPMEEALTYFSLTPDQQVTRVVTVSEETLSSWAAETEINDSEGAISKDGSWAVNLASVQQNSTAIKMVDLLNAQGYAAQIQQKEISDNLWSRIQIRGFKSSESARYFADKINGRFGIAGPWILKLQAP